MTRPSPFDDLRLLHWDGERLTLEDEPHFAIYVDNRQALAEAVLRVACGDAAPTGEEAKMFADEVLGQIFDGPFQMTVDAARRWLEASRGMVRGEIPRQAQPDETPQLIVKCSWCLHEQGIKPKPDESHGICSAHKRQVLVIDPLREVLTILRDGSALGLDIREDLAAKVGRAVRALEREGDDMTSAVGKTSPKQAP